MIAVLQRVTEAHISIDNEIVDKIDLGLLILLGVVDNDTIEDGRFLSEKIAGFRIFADEQGKMNLSIKDVRGSVLVVSQFTLCGDWRKGRRPSFIHAAPPAKGEELYEDFLRRLHAKGIPVGSGHFGAMMKVHLVNDGPVTFVLDSKQA
jgi:D-tyrosyl-tRNA(Tyr) deacylase